MDVDLSKEADSIIDKSLFRNLIPLDIVMVRMPDKQ